jgi:hypothetical protein
MAEILQMLQSPLWWFQVVFIGIFVNLISHVIVTNFRFSFRWFDAIFVIYIALNALSGIYAVAFYDLPQEPPIQILIGPIAHTIEKTVVFILGATIMPALLLFEIFYEKNLNKYLGTQSLRFSFALTFLGILAYCAYIVAVSPFMSFSQVTIEYAVKLSVWPFAIIFFMALVQGPRFFIFYLRSPVSVGPLVKEPMEKVRKKDRRPHSRRQ